jgi:hypothetical protein
MCFFSDINDELSEKIKILQGKKQVSSRSSSDFDSENKRKKVRALRIEPISFSDDGRARAMDLYVELQDELDNEDLALLKKAATLAISSTMDFTLLANLKKRLLKDFNTFPEFIIQKPDSEVCELYFEVKSSIQSRKDLMDRKELILSNWLMALENDPMGLQEAIKDCNFAFAATVQQTEGTEILKEKGIQGNALSKFYATLIVDEAARATPPDLLIPMCKATERIILVGDHRQLPQFIDEKLLDLMETENLGSMAEKETYFRSSLFEHLIDRLKKLQKEDGIQRIITLDRQFRTSKLLGQFASDWFYKPYGEGYESSRPDSDFSHQLPGIEGKFAVWVDIPASKGKEIKRNTSYYRQEEITQIAQYIKKWMTSETGQKFSFGIISFYGAQVQAITQELENSGIDLTDQKTRIKIGSVDSFQGMEFDVILLSVVRSNTKNQYGFLKSKNRLCVSMTRQKSVLAVFGDSNFLSSKVAREKDNIPALAAFYDLCNEKGVVL